MEPLEKRDYKFDHKFRIIPEYFKSYPVLYTKHDFEQNCKSLKIATYTKSFTALLVKFDDLSQELEVRKKGFIKVCSFESSFHSKHNTVLTALIPQTTMVLPCRTRLEPSAVDIQLPLFPPEIKKSKNKN